MLSFYEPAPLQNLSVWYQVRLTFSVQHILLVLIAIILRCYGAR